MTDELTERQKKHGGWTDEKRAEYFEARAKAAMDRIFHNVDRNGRRREAKIERGPGLHEPKLTDEVKERIRLLRKEGMTVPAIMKQTELSKASVYRALAV